MTIRLPTAEDLHRIAADNYFELNDEELEAFQSVLPGLFSGYEILEQMPLPKEPLKYRDRDPGYRPSREEDPLNAIFRKCSLRGAASGKLAGKRFGLKNNICVAGMPMSAGSRLLEGYVPETDATVVTRLLDAGAEIVATLNLEDFAFSGGGDTCAYGAVGNPHNPEYSAGGSSSGSAAALHYDDIDITIGGDQGGSIRVPASFCGIVGLKPTHGLVPYTGIVGIDNTFDHAGPMSRTVPDAALTLEVIAGKDPLDPRQAEVPVQPYIEALGSGVKGLRIGVVTEGFGTTGAETDVDAAVRKALGVFNELGAQTADVSVPDHTHGGAIAWGLVVEGAAALMHGNGMGHGWMGQYNLSLMETLGKSLQAQANDLPPTVKLILLVGNYMNERYHGRMYGKAQNLRRVLRGAYDKALEQFDVLAMPTTPMKAHKYDPDQGIENLLSVGWRMFGNTQPMDMTGHPAISIPCAKSDGLPVGLMLIGKPFDDAMVLRVAHAFEQHVSWETL